jgi:hypothetical protein
LIKADGTVLPPVRTEFAYRSDSETDLFRVNLTTLGGEIGGCSRSCRRERKPFKDRGTNGLKVSLTAVREREYGDVGIWRFSDESDGEMNGTQLQRE